MEYTPLTPALIPLCRVNVALAPPLVIGPTPQGLRRIIPIVGGDFVGERMRGNILNGGADWQIVRDDGVAILHARYTLQTDDGALIYIQNDGIRHASPDVVARLGRGEAVDPSEYYMRTTPKFETAHPHYGWLNRIIAVGSGIRRADAVVIDFFELT
ncbi:MAG: DUF3237 domain-containing protein [Anaerolineae bacterium]|nr:DUF3237 domain-containing protein [Anaerolineae bacterium]